ncbi:GntR family transcriptional regulator [Ornithinibacillus gellani]|uniref:GntR family transcriptional regulator n=1 Tax=Ornithinibacillus gellani TaxID=2293253 RepID=UPI000F46008E|nr:GntR family transcriptional regulator [Ornithinibacillus gellani]TQS75502.1 GntR family transcriptional regulator [Ornithinibacillus gellani]
MSIKADSRLLYLQVIDEIKRGIENHTYKAKEKLPSEYLLSKQLGVSRATLREALRILEEEGTVTRRHGVGTFVNSKPMFSSGIEELSSVTDMIEQAGKQPGSIYLSTEMIDPSKDEMEKFNQIHLQRLTKIERVRTADGEPVVFCVDKVPEGYIPIEKEPVGDSIFHMMEQHLQKRITYAVAYIEPVGYNERIHHVLKCDKNQPLFLLKQMHYTEDDEPVLYSANYFRPDIFRFHVLRKRV